MGGLENLNQEIEGDSRGKASQLAAEISGGINSRKFTLLEIRRLERDLSLARSRLYSREYRQCNFAPRNMLSIPDRSDEIFKDLTFFWSVARIWQTLINNTFKESYGSVLELGCGHFSKVGLGLIYSKFSGCLSLLDSDSKACTRAALSLQYLGAVYSVEADNSSIFSTSTECYDAILANHFLDDLILSSYCSRNKLNLGSLYSDEKLYAEAWDKITAKPELVWPLLKRLAVTLDQRTRPGGLIVLLDYRSFSHRSLRLGALMNFVKKAQDQLRAELRFLGNRELEALPELSLKVDRLKVCSRDIIAFRKVYAGRRPCREELM